MSIEDKVLKDFEVGLLTIVLSLILGTLIYFVSLFTNTYPPLDMEIIIKRIVALTPSEFSPLTLSFIFMSILDLSAFHKLRNGFRILNSGTHYGGTGLSLLIISSIFLLFGNIELLLSGFLFLMTKIIIFAWIAFMVVSIVFGMAGTLLLGLEFRNLGNLYKNNQIEKGAILIMSVILSYVGYIIVYVGIRNLRNQKSLSRQNL